MAGSDVKAKRLAGTGAASVGRARLRQVYVTVNNTGAGRLTITDGDGGATLFDVDLSTNLTHSVEIPDEGIVATSDLYVSAFTNIDAITILYS